MSNAGFVFAERELLDFYTSTLGVAAQRYDSDHGGAYDVNDAHLRLRVDSHRRALDRHAAAECTLAKLDPRHRRTLAIVYAPHSWPALLGLAFGRGFGSFVGLAIRTMVAQEAFASAHGKGSVIDWLAAQAGRGHQAPKGLQRAIVDECASTLRVALAAYEPLRRDRIEGEKRKARQATIEREEAFRMTLGRRRSSRPPSPDLVRVAELVGELAGVAAE